jgi:hypothetical protein
MLQKYVLLEHPSRLAALAPQDGDLCTNRRF